MPNSYFQFKQFTIRQDKTAMKVTTDACLFGGWIADFCQRKWAGAGLGHVLDVGTGTGLLSLMLAQKTEAMIEAIEIDRDAAMQAKENIESSVWKRKIKVIHADVKKFRFERQFDLVISNPPFYEHDLKSPLPAKNRAMHDTALTLQDLARIVGIHLVDWGYFAVLLPSHRMEHFHDMAGKNRLTIKETVLVKPTPKHQVTRALMLFQKAGAGTENYQPVTKELLIKEVHHSYTDDFVYYLKDYYLSL